MEPLHFIADLAVIMLAAALMAVVCQWLRQPVVLGYVIAGVLVGPHVPYVPVVTDRQTIDIMAELGLVLLMFSLGLEFSFKKIGQLGLSAIVVALVKLLVVFWLGFEIGLLFSWSYMDALFLGGLLSISSTTIIYKILEDMGLKREPFAKLILGTLILEDILAIALIAALTGIAQSNTVQAEQVSLSMIRLIIFVVVAVLTGLLIVPKLISRLGKLANNDVLIIAVLGLCFGVCLIVIKLHYSVALGAFLIGAVIAESDEVLKITRLIEPIKVMFSAIFFVSIGLLLDLSVVADEFIPVMVITLVMIVGKVFSGSVAAFFSGQSGLTSVRVGMGLAQIGEFSFVIAALGTRLEVTSAFLYPIAVAVSLLSTFTTPYLLRAARPTTDFLSRIIPGRIAVPMAMYSEWLRAIHFSGEQKTAGSMIRRILRHVVVNLLLVAGIFLTVSYFSNPWPQWISPLVEQERIRHTIAWAVSAILSLPFLIAILRKLQALAMILVELSVHNSSSSRLTRDVRSILAGIIPFGAVIMLTLFVSTLSTSILPPIDLLIMIFLLVLLIGTLGWRKLTRLHADLQASLRETLSSAPDES